MIVRVVLACALCLFSSVDLFAQATQGSTYFIAPGAGTESGFQQAGGPFDDSVVNGGGELIGLDLSGDGMILSSDELIQNTAVNFDLVFRIETVGGNLAPSGVLGDSGVELVSLGLFVGGGLNPVDLDQPVFANEALIEVYDSSELSLGTIDVSQMGNFTSGVGGGWDGSLGINFFNQIEIGDVGAIELRINFDTVPVPEPSSAIFLSCLGAGVISRRVRRIA